MKNTNMKHITNVISSAITGAVAVAALAFSMVTQSNLNAAKVELNELQDNHQTLVESHECLKQDFQTLEGTFNDYVASDTLLDKLNLGEFSSPDDKGSWKKMNPEFVALVQEAMALSGFKWQITSGFRTCSHNKRLIKRGYPAARNSWHMPDPNTGEGHAADILAVTKGKQRLIVNSLKKAGITSGIKVYKHHVHVQWKNDSNKWENTLVMK